MSLANLHLTEEIIELSLGPYVNYVPDPSIKFDGRLLNVKYTELSLETNLELVNKDTITAALEAIENGYNPLVLNMANHLKPGGGWRSGALAQEEHLFRCTNLFRTLTEELYPISEHVIYSPKVHIIRNAEYSNLDKPVIVSFASVAALQKHNGCTRLAGSDIETTRKRIQLLFHLAAVAGHDCIILGALGCGAFHNPPHIVAQIFAEVISDYSTQFKQLIFAIKCGPGNPNLSTFTDYFLCTFGDPSEEVKARVAAYTREESPTRSDSINDYIWPFDLDAETMECLRDSLGRSPTLSEIECFIEDNNI